VSAARRAWRCVADGTALESRRKKKEFFGDLEERYKEKEDACEALEKRCRDLEQE
jgi:hypothetical protein